MNYINTITDQYPVSEQEIRSLFPNTSFPNPFIAPEEYSFVFPSPKPQHDSNLQYCTESAPVLTSKGHYEQVWLIHSLEQNVIEANLINAKTQKNAEINEARLKANFSTFQHLDKTFACDQLSRSDIDGTNGFVSLYGTLPQGWQGGWKAVDNSYIAITSVNDWKAFYSSMFAQGNANFLHAQSLKTNLEQATTLQEVQAITWDTAV